MPGIRVDDEAATGREVSRRVAEAGDLLALGPKIAEPVPHEIDERESPGHRAVRHVTDDDRDVGPLFRSLSTMGCESSMPLTGMPRSARGMATRPVPIASSSAAPSPARSDRKRTAGSRTSGANMKAELSSWCSAVSASHRSLLVMGGVSPMTIVVVHLFCRR